MTTKTKDPLLPLELVFWVLSRFMLLFLVVSVVLMPFRDVSIAGINDPHVCRTVDTDVALSPPMSTDALSRALELVPPGGDFRHGSIHADATSVCLDDASLGTQVVGNADTVFRLLWFLGILLITLRMIKVARTDGLFTTGTARILRWLGWWVTLGSLFQSLLSQIADQRIVADALGTDAAWGFPGWPSLDPAVLLTGIGIITFARVMRQAVELQDDVDATI